MYLSRRSRHFWKEVNSAFSSEDSGAAFRTFLHVSECVRLKGRERGDLLSALGIGIPASGPSGASPRGWGTSVSSELRPLTDELAVPPPMLRLRSASEAACAWIVAGISGEPCPCAQSFSWIWSQAKQKEDRAEYPVEAVIR